MKLSAANIRSVLDISGPMTMQELAQFFPGTSSRRMSGWIAALRLPKKQLHIQSWTMEGMGRRYPRPIYALGNKRDAAKPKPVSQSTRMKEYRQRMKVPNIPNSVFAWGQM